MALSKLGNNAVEAVSHLAMMWDVMRNPWDPIQRPRGWVNIGVAENALMKEEILAHIKSHFNPPLEILTYGQGGSGTDRLRAATARFLTEHLKPVKPILPEHVCITNGCTGAIEQTSFLFANEGDVILLGRPYYSSFKGDFELRPRAKTVEVAFGSVDPMSVEAMAAYEKAILDCKSKGQRVATVMLCHPHNPLGRCYSRDAIIALMKICNKHKVHLISDEIYALSVFENRHDKEPAAVPFESISTIDPSGIIDPSLVHILWGFSKDFSANGLRLGVIVSQNNPNLHEALKLTSIWTWASLLADYVATSILEDDAFTDKFITTNKQRLSDMHDVTVRWAKSVNIDYAPGINAAFFMWLDLGKKYREQRPDVDIDDGDVNQKVMDALVEEKVFLTDGRLCGSEAVGWFRLVFTVPLAELNEGLRRIERVIFGKSAEWVLVDRTRKDQTVVASS